MYSFLRTLVRLQIMLIVVFGSLTGIVILIGRAMPPSERLTSLHLTDCKLPCWAGIIPDDTILDADHAQDRLEELFSRDVYEVVPQNNPFRYTIRGKNEPQNSGVQLQLLGFVRGGPTNLLHMSGVLFQSSSKDEMPLLGDVISWFGIPDVRTPTVRGITFYFTDCVAIIGGAVHSEFTIESPTPFWTSPISDFIFSVTNNNQDCHRKYPWRGLFTTKR